MKVLCHMHCLCPWDLLVKYVFTFGSIIFYSLCCFSAFNEVYIQSLNMLYTYEVKCIEQRGKDKNWTIWNKQLMKNTAEMSRNHPRHFTAKFGSDAGVDQISTRKNTHTLSYTYEFMRRDRSVGVIWVVWIRASYPLWFPVWRRFLTWKNAWISKLF